MVILSDSKELASNKFAFVFVLKVYLIFETIINNSPITFPLPPDHTQPWMRKEGAF